MYLAGEDQGEKTAREDAMNVFKSLPSRQLSRWRRKTKQDKPKQKKSINGQYEEITDESGESDVEGSRGDTLNATKPLSERLERKRRRWATKSLQTHIHHTALTPCFSVQIKHKIGKNMNSVQQQCKHHH